MTNTGVELDTDIDQQILGVTFERHNVAHCTVGVQFAGQIEDELPDFHVSDTKDWQVEEVMEVDDRPVVIGEFYTEAEAMACMVGLDYIDRTGAKTGRFRILGPSEGDPQKEGAR